MKSKVFFLCFVLAAATFLFLSRTAYASNVSGTVKCTGYLNIRNSTSTSSKIIGKLYPGTKVSILGTYGNWYKISFKSKTGFVYSLYISKDLNTSKTVTVVLKSAISSEASRIIDFAKRFVGVRYVYGGAGPSGFDCSGFTMYVFKTVGVNLTHSASAQSRQGKAVSMSNLKPGNLIFFDTDGGRNNITHAGIYIGNGNFIHASLKGVMVDNLSKSYYSSRYMGASEV